MNDTDFRIFGQPCIDLLLQYGGVLKGWKYFYFSYHAFDPPCFFVVLAWFFIKIFPFVIITAWGLKVSIRSILYFAATGTLQTLLWAWCIQAPYRLDAIKLTAVRADFRIKAPKATGQSFSAGNFGQAYRTGSRSDPRKSIHYKILKNISCTPFVSGCLEFKFIPLVIAIL